ncbi:DUF2624 domain-containing protein [Virgibacillus doumboii]|uniref:DUF2624 domain-containing protein n=1 Tax=Virgibacillus doumboii TaxID=2697503 RepID=UPI0013DFD8DD|nr:DUF2624 domain-containing protein [Virgibacillus doumboii]
MSKFIKDLVTQKMKQLTPDELLHYSHQYGFHISRNQAKQITTYIQNHPIDPFDAQSRTKLFEELERITDRDTAQKAFSLFREIIKTYGLGHLFN